MDGIMNSTRWPYRTGRYLFRGKVVGEDKFVEGDLCCLNTGLKKYLKVNTDICIINNDILYPIQVDSLRRGLYTFQGRTIFEYDIVKVTYRVLEYSYQVHKFVWLYN